MLETAIGPEEWIAGSEGITAAAINSTWQAATERRFEGASDLRCKVQLAGNSHYSYGGEGATGASDPQIMYVYKPRGSFKDEHIEAGVHERSITLVFPVSDDDGVLGCGREDPSMDKALRLMGPHLLMRQRAMSRMVASVAASILDADRSARNFDRLRRLRIDELACLTLDAFLDGFADTTDHSVTARERRQIHEARDILVADLGTPPSVSRLAAMVGTNRNKLNRGFQVIFGMSPYQFLHQERMTQARALLEDGCLSVTDIAAHCGYDHASNFSLAVKAFHGQAPSALRGQSLSHSR